MNSFVNDAFRFVIARTIILVGIVSDLWQRLRIRRFKANQKRLKRKYRLQSDTPVVSYGPRVVESIRHAAARAGRDARFAMTSGSTGEPKQILYTKHRLRNLKFAFSDMFARACCAYALKRTSLYVFSSFQRDASLTSLLLAETKIPPYLSTLQAPYRVQQHAAIQTLFHEYGGAAVRLWILTITNPGVLYATNPSTISTFFDEVKTNWIACSKLARDWHNDPHQFSPTVHRIARRLDSRGSAERLRLIAIATNPLRLGQFAPAVNAYICWTGGYVKPFLDRLVQHLPPSRYRLIPMYSMSTETVETETLFRNGDTHFLPLASGTVYEFLHANANDDPQNILTPDQLRPGESYAMVVSDSYGLRRYQTGDLFECRRTSNGLPDLAFLRRRALEYSFAGEKVTAEQLTTVFEQLRSGYAQVFEAGFLTCVPSLPRKQNPHYKLLLIHDCKSILNTDLLAKKCDALLRELNCEYNNKRVQGVLDPIRFLQTTPGEFAERFVGAWETQFKFLPLYRRTWESTDVPHLNARSIRLSHKNTHALTQTTSLQ